VNRSPDDPNNEPTQMAGYDYGGNGNYGEPAYYSESREPSGRQPAWTQPPPPTPWYLRPVALVGLGVLTALLIALLVWGMVRLVNKEPSPTAPATTSVTSTTSAPVEEPATPVPAQAPSDSPTDEIPPPATESQTPTSTTEAPSTTTTTEPATTGTTVATATSAANHARALSLLFMSPVLLVLPAVGSRSCFPLAEGRTQAPRTKALWVGKSTRGRCCLR